MITTRTLALTLVGLATALGTAAAQQGSARSTDSQTVVFVCEHGTVKSVLALAWFEQMVRARHLPYKAISRGTRPDSALPRFMIDGLGADGLHLDAFAPTLFTERDLASAVAVISFDQPVVATRVAGRVPTAAWDNLPSVTADYRIARDSIKNRVAALVDSLARQDRRPEKTSRPR